MTNSEVVMLVLSYLVLWLHFLSENSYSKFFRMMAFSDVLNLLSSIWRVLSVQALYF